jgi:hypothetical protein
MNTSRNERKVDFADYEERTQGFAKAEDIITKALHSNSFNIPAMTMNVYELKP